MLSLLLSRHRKTLLFLLLLLAATEFTLRGPVRLVRSADQYNDLTSSYIGAKAWIKGLNPYSNDVFWTLWNQSGRPDLQEPESESIGSRTPYPWGSFLVLAPLTFLRWAEACVFSGLLSTGMLLLSIWLLSRLPELGVGSGRRLLFIGLSLALAPLPAGIHTGNLSMLAIALFLLSFWASYTQRPVLAGLCCGLAASIKPPIGLTLVLYYGMSRRWRALACSLASAFLITAVGAGRLQVAGVSWLSSYLANTMLALTDPLNRIIEANPKRFQMVNLEVLWYTITRDERTAYVLSLLIGGILTISVCVVLLRSARRTPQALEVGALAVISLLPVYHRFYDATLLILPLFWGLSVAPPKAGRYQRLALVLMLPFAIPGAWALESLQNAGRIPQYLTTGWWWDTVVMSHQIWALLLLSLVLVTATWITATWDKGAGQVPVEAGVRQGNDSSASSSESVPAQYTPEPVQARTTCLFS